MATLLWLIPVLPLLGFLVLGIFGRAMSRRLVAAIGVGLVGVSAALTLILALRFAGSPPPGDSLTASYWTWFEAGGLNPGISFRLDALSLVFSLVVTCVGFLIHLYSAGFMAGDEGYSRFFAWMNLFVGSMLVLVLGSNLLVLYLGWEGVGLCSYLLIGFWYKDPKNVRAAAKAFIVTRVGDTALAVGLLLIVTKLGTLDIQEVAARAVAQWPAGSALAVAAAALLVGGAVGKSAQLPLQTWLPDAMAGPTPVSALIHAATMVTAGVYLIARMHVLFELAPPVRLAVGVLGAATLLIAGASALVQVDIKRILAYSTMSQIGYMFLALGAGAWSAAVFHFVTHAFFKALLFLGAGVIILGLKEEHDIFKMGGMRKELPLVFWTFLAGAASLAALPLVTAGFYSKEWILSAVRSGGGGAGAWLYAAGLAGAFLTVLYTFRVVFAVFFGPAKTPISRRPGLVMKLPLVVLAFFSLTAGFLETPRVLGNLPLFSNFLQPVLTGRGPMPKSASEDGLLVLASSVVVLAGLVLAYALIVKRAGIRWLEAGAGPVRQIRRFLFAGFGFDRLYDRVFVRPLAWLSRVNRNDVVDLPFRGLAVAVESANGVLARTQTGRLRRYMAAVVLGAVIVLTVAVFL
ncbi:MAG: NADH-quinone oxidoreductase subunit L [Candidatus Aminicenantes bacterium RBG_16_66_30]